MTSALTKLPKNTVKLIITLSWAEVKDVYEKSLAKIVKEAELPGFRKGKAPKKLVEEKIDKTKIYEEVLKTLIPKAYSDALKEHNLSPIISPRVNVLKVDEGSDWQFEVLTCLEPTVKLNDYKKEIAKLKASKKIWVPGKDLKKQSEEEKKGVELSEAFRVLLDQAEVEISDLLVEDQVNKKLADLIDQTKHLGLTVEQYLLSKGLTSEMLREQYKKEALETLKLEFILEKIADEEKITVSSEEVEAFFKKISDQKQKEMLEKQRYYVSMLIRRQKTIDFLIKPIV